ncbi:MAG: MBL fold metallo-hydrolase [Salibacteraceae bacterium]
MSKLKVTFLGTGTSMGVPVIACDCPVCTSADTRDNRLRSSILIEKNNTTLCIDSGPDFRTQMLTYQVKKLDGLIYTHEHKDHTAGMDDVRAFNFILRKPMVLYTDERVEKALRNDFYYAFTDTKYPGVPEIRFHRIDEELFTVNGIEIQPLPVMHHKLPVLGFRVDDFSYITDANYIPESTMELLQGTKVLVLNALRKTSHISHFTLEEAVKVAKDVGAEKTYLTHISHQMGRHQEVAMELPPSVEIAFDGQVIELG